MSRRICLEDGCGKIAGPRGRCPMHERARDLARGRRQERGYGIAHVRIRARLLRAWAQASRRGETWYCPRCEQPLVPGQPVDADHFSQELRDNPGATADALSHRSCN